ncbi:aminomethyl-transferring glycine dehydrogenase subunit GcvPA [Capillimicrobium parvum]|uniref:Probable glycine dehydrogenase (decarboxylating) subunit 1 n=1 Tax=Capillimicrobium parvum TaxID=2884022 RepID=A0A9E7C0U5_9ACTN|nr:aminomethyl-transferring glycine dehydrogenase subunit GcvPA [Capillimicrobium parvum]UGS35758.1 putative glycine dehydrogenase (decarboxylating) subunit 1 [Capillimicrobium parvum]
MSTYTAITDADREAMLAAIGLADTDELFAAIPAALRLGRPLDLPPGQPEQDVYAHLRELAARNVSAEDEITFLGGGMYDHYVPALIDMLMSRSEFLTPYTPYQPEVSQGGLQVMFEYQTAISELTALPVANASVYEGPSALASAGYLAKLVNGRPRLVVSAGVHPHAIETLRTYAQGFGAEVVEVALRDGATDLDAWRAAIDDETGAVFFANPNFLGAVEDAEALAAAAGGGTGDERSRPVVIASYDPITLGILKPPGECGVDVCVGEGQPLGNRLDFGGPSFGFFAATEAYLRRMPGRIAGETVDADGRRGFVLTLQTREQHIRREKATSNICTAQALNALGGVVYLAWLGRRGIVELGELLLQRTHYAREALCAIDGVEPLHRRPVIREFAVTLPEWAPVDDVVERCAAEGVNPGLALPEHNGLLVAITEQRSRADIDRLAAVLADAVAEQAGKREMTGASNGRH